MSSRNPHQLRIALPSKGALDQDTRQYLGAAGLKVVRPNERQYVGTIAGIPQISVLFQRAADIFTKVNEGSADLGITGYDIVCEMGTDSDRVITIDRLGYGACSLVLAVPDSWIDVVSLDDLADLTLRFKDKGRELRIATKFTNLTRQWLFDKRIVNFSVVEAHGALEAAPSMGYADIIVDLTSTGTTLRENRLRELTNGTIVHSEACLIGNQRSLKHHPEKLALTRQILEAIEAQQAAKQFLSITANVQGHSPEAIGDILMQAQGEQQIAGLRGPTVANVYSPHANNWYAATIVVQRTNLLAAIELLRQVGGRDITVIRPNFVFGEKCHLYHRLEQTLGIRLSEGVGH